MLCPYRYIKDRDIHLERYDFRSIRGVCSRIGDRTYIGVSRSLSSLEEREVLAHEIGHIEDHTENMVHVSLAERRAEKIGRELLIPQEDLLRVIEEHEGEADACFLAQCFGVRIETMVQRIREVFRIS